METTWGTVLHSIKLRRPFKDRFQVYSKQFSWFRPDVTAFNVYVLIFSSIKHREHTWYDLCRLSNRLVTHRVLAVKKVDYMNVK